MLSKVSVRSKRFLLREYTLDDLECVVGMFSDQYAQRFYPDMSSREQARAWIERNRDRYEALGFGLWVIEYRNLFIGDCGLTYQTTDDGPLLEIGYHLLAEYRGRGFATEAGRACLRHAFEQLQANLVVSIVHPENVASSAVATRIHAGVRETRQRGEPRRLFYTKREHHVEMIEEEGKST